MRDYGPGLALALIVAATLVAYRGALDNGFVLDDHHTIVTNRSLDSFAGAGRWFLSGEGVSGRSENTGYRPVLMASYALDRAVWGEGPRGYHAGNVLIHLAVVLLAFVLGRRLWGGRVGRRGGVGLGGAASSECRCGRAVPTRARGRSLG